MSDNLVFGHIPLKSDFGVLEYTKANKEIMKNCISTKKNTLVYKIGSLTWNNTNDETMVLLYASKFPFVFTDLSCSVMVVENFNPYRIASMKQIDGSKNPSAKYFFSNDLSNYSLYCFKSVTDTVFYENDLILKCNILEFAQSNKYQLNNVFS